MLWKQVLVILSVIPVVASFPAGAGNGGARGGEEAAGQPADMVLIPAGEFFMGTDNGDDSSPRHRVALEAFYLDRHEVTNARYFEFCQQTGRKLPEFWGMEEFHCGLSFPEHPVVGVSWLDATAYAEWAGKRLPTEGEWEYAARGGLEGKDFPNGDDLDDSLANVKSSGTVPVGSYPPNGYGLFDMAGNVVEWVHDYYDADYYGRSPLRNPTGPEKGKFVVIRGGGWHSGRYCNRVAHRNALIKSWVDINVGFRCAKDAE